MFWLFRQLLGVGLALLALGIAAVGLLWAGLALRALGRYVLGRYSPVLAALALIALASGIDPLWGIIAWAGSILPLWWWYRVRHACAIRNCPGPHPSHA